MTRQESIISSEVEVYTTRELDTAAVEGVVIDPVDELIVKSQHVAETIIADFFDESRGGDKSTR